MARLSRLSLPGIAQHVIQRGNNRQVCFFTEEDYPVYLDKLKEIRDAVNKICIKGVRVIDLLSARSRVGETQLKGQTDGATFSPEPTRYSTTRHPARQ